MAASGRRPGARLGILVRIGRSARPFVVVVVVVVVVVGVVVVVVVVVGSVANARV